MTAIIHCNMSKYGNYFTTQKLLFKNKRHSIAKQLVFLLHEKTTQQQSVAKKICDFRKKRH